MPLSPEEFVRHYPRLYHMAEQGTWQSVRDHGLLSTSALLDLFEIAGPRRYAIESQRRESSVTVEHPRYGVAVIRDQLPLSDGALLKCLRDITPEDWYRILNSKVFFWVTSERLMRLLTGRAYRSRTHCIITVDSTRMLERHLPRITLTPINAGSTIYNPQPRGRETFKPLAEYPFESWKKKRGKSNAIAELAVAYSVPDIAELAVRVEHIRQGKVVEVLYQE